MHIFEVYEKEEDDEALENTDILDILSHVAEWALTVNIQGWIQMKTSFFCEVVKNTTIVLAPQ